MRFSLSPELLDALRQHRQERAAGRTWRVDVEEDYDAFCLDPGLGAALYITSDGRVLEDGRGWGDAHVCEASDNRAIVALVSGAKKTGITALLDLIPPPPPGATTCPRCNGTRYFVVHPYDHIILLCETCYGRCWATPEMIADGESRWPSR